MPPAAPETAAETAGKHVPPPRPARGGFGQVFHSLFCLLFPDACRVCRRPLERWTAAPVCDACLEALEPMPVRLGRCPVCALPLDTPGVMRCGPCASGEYEFDRARSFGIYEGALRELLHLLKYRGMRPLARPLGGRVAQSFLEAWTPEEFDCIVPVPLARRRERQRGFNQAELLAREVSSRLHLPLLGGACTRVRPTRPQTGLTRAQRLDNLRAAFAPGPRAADLAGRRVLLVDDVFTTGATLSVCARVLRGAGAQHVAALTVARTLLH